MRVLLLGTCDPAAHPRVGVLVEGLRAHGVQVRECTAPLGLDTAARVALLQQPWRLPVLGGRLVRAWASLALRARRGPVPDAVLVGYLGHFDVHLARALFPRTPLVLDHLVFAADTASDRGQRGAVRQWLLRRLDEGALRTSDVVLVDTEEHLAEVPPAWRDKAVVVAVGAPGAWYAAAPPAPADPAPPGAPLRVVFFGLYTPLQGAPTIGAALARQVPGRVQATMVGSGQDLAATRRAAGAAGGIRWVDWVSPAELPALVAGHDVCLGVFGAGPKALRVVPNKVFQGLAAGCAVLTSDTAPQRRLLGDAALLVAPDDPDALAAALRRLALDPAERHRLAAAGRAQAERFRPREVVAPLLARLGAPADRPARMITGGVVGLPPLPPGAALRWDVVRRLLPPPGARVLEVGCGGGAFGARLAGRGPYLGVEPDAVSAAQARARIEPRGGVVAEQRVEDLPAGSTYDVVCAFEVIEHLEDDAGALDAWVRRLAPGGMLLVSTPAGPHRMGAWDAMVGHYRRYDAGALAGMLREAGLSEVRVVHTGFPLGYALEGARNVVARRRGWSAPGTLAMQERTSGSGRQLQPSRQALGVAVRVATAPFLLTQRLVPARGTGLLAVGLRTSPGAQA